MTDPIHPRGPSLLRNPVSIAGLILAVISTALGLPMMLLEIFTGKSNPYLGVFIYMVFPIVSTVGVMLVFAGVWRERRRRERHPGMRIPPLPRIDLNSPRQRMILLGATACLLLLLTLMSVTSYRAYHYSDSVRFCGEVCHQVMKPEYTAYQFSPHARVACAACHIGPGASGFVRSKITGAYQIYSVTFHKYARPIPTPIKNLRPAQETCEQCHWPSKFFGSQEKTFRHYLADEKNSAWQIQMLMKIGGGDPRVTATTGIHWHMNIKNDIYYVASDAGRQTIPWVKAVDREGHVTEYMTTENPLTPAELSKAALRRLDCIDCHNRPSHNFNAPDRSVEQALAAGRLDTSLPYLKREAMRLLSGTYVSEEQARAAILKELPGFYEKNYPVLYREKGVAIRQAADVVQQIFSANFFPEMKTDWRAHPDNIGHLNTEGCFRCHDGLHKSRDGRIIPNDCNACHTILAQGSPAEIARGRLQPQAFRHPVDVGMDVTTLKCNTCHTGTTGL